jgi:2-methylcitrate dehydratase PrpD
LWALLSTIKVVENEEYTRAYRQMPRQHHARVTVVKSGGETLTGKSGGDKDDMASARSDEEIENKFRGLADDSLGPRQGNAILEQLWHLEDIDDVARIPGAFVIV